MTDTPREQADVTREPTGGQSCRVVVDGDEDESYLVCLACDPGREVCCGHHRAPHDESGCRATIGVNPSIKCACTRREPTGGQGLREAMARALYGLMGYTRPWSELEDWRQEKWRGDADPLLALPELAAHLADAERVRRVREAIHDFDAFQDPASRAMAMWRLRRALDGEPQP